MRSSNASHQLSFYDMPSKAEIVNVASVPQRSPFRYPGGKTWLVPKIKQWLRSLPWKPALFVEPFAGGGIVGLNVAFDDLAERVVLVELDEQVAAVWRTMLSDDNDWLSRKILAFELTEENVRHELSTPANSIKEMAFKTILKNRTFHGGILAPGSSLIKSGENGKGLRSRWYAQTLARRITAIGRIHERFRFTEGDGIQAIRQCSKRKKVAFFIDPPYTVAGKKAGSRLYSHHSLDHEKLFSVAENIAGDFLMTYDNDNAVERLALRYGFQTALVAMKNTHHAQMDELLIGRDLSWLS